MVHSQFNLLWDSHKSSLCNGLRNLQMNGEFVDMTIAADGHFVKVHQMVIALASPYLKELITSAPCQHPVIFLNNVSHRTLCSLLEYIYTGEVLLPAEQLGVFVETAKSLHIKGMENMNNSECLPVRMSANLTTSLEANEIRNIISPVVKTEQITPLIKKVVVKADSNTSTAGAHSLQTRSVVIPANVMPDYALPDDHAQDSDEEHDFRNQTHLEPQAPAIIDNRADKMSSNLQFTVSIRGSLQVILNRYIYNLHSVTHRTGVRRWRCVDYRNHKCMAYVVSKKNVVLSRRFVPDPWILNYLHFTTTLRCLLDYEWIFSDNSRTYFGQQYIFPERALHLGRIILGLTHKRCLTKHIHLDRGNLHNHPFHDKKILSKIEKNVVYSALDDVEGYKDKEPTEDTAKDDSAMEHDGDYLSLDFSDDSEPVAVSIMKP